MSLPPRGFIEFRVPFDLGFAGIAGLLQRRFVRTCLGGGSVGRECKSAEENRGGKPLELDHLINPSFCAPPLSDFKVTRGRSQMHISGTRLPVTGPNAPLPRVSPRARPGS
jgi:hypothetical protein